MRILGFFLLSALVVWTSCGDMASGGKKMATTMNGYQYEHHVKNEGPTIQAGEYAYIHYVQRLDDSTLNTSRQMGDVQKIQLFSEEQLKNEPNALQEGLSFMSKGDSLSVYIPIDSLPQDRIPPNFKNYNNLIVDIYLQDIKTEADFQAEMDAQRALLAAKTNEVKEMVEQTAKDYSDGKLKDQLVVSETGLKYIIHEEGTGSKNQKGETVYVDYYGALTDGKEFDNSFKTGQPLPLKLGSNSVIAGWEEGIAYLNKGAKATLFIPYELAYGEAGRPPQIPPKSELIFYVEIGE